MTLGVTQFQSEESSARDDRRRKSHALRAFFIFYRGMTNFVCLFFFLHLNHKHLSRCDKKKSDSSSFKIWNVFFFFLKI